MGSMGIRQVISTLSNGNDELGMKRLAWRYPDDSVTDKSLLTVEANQFCVVKSRGVLLDVYDVGQHEIRSGDKPIMGSFVQAFWGGSSPWQFEVIYLQRSKIRIQNQGVATTKEMAEISYVADYYVHVDNTEDAVKLITHMPLNGHVIEASEIAEYAGPAIEQAINQKIQLLALEDINIDAPSILEACKTELTDFLKAYGITLNDLKVVFFPSDKRIREIVSFRALGLNNEQAVQAWLASVMAEQGIISAPNMFVGSPFQIGYPGFMSMAGGGFSAAGGGSSSPSATNTPTSSTGAEGAGPVTGLFSD